MKTPNSFLPKLYIKTLGIHYGKSLKLAGWPFIFKDKRSTLSLGNEVTINSSFLSNLIGINHRSIIISKDGGSVTIGDNVGMSGVTIYSKGKGISIGKNTLMGSNSKIFDTDFHPIDPTDRLRQLANKQSVELTSKSVSIGENVFIGCDCIILKGTRIGDNCVIGAGSIVSGEFEANSVIAGNPAKVIRKINVTN